MGVPDSGVPAAEGYAAASAASPTARGWSRTATSAAPSSPPTQAERASGVRRKLNPLRENIAGKRLDRGGRLDRAGHHHPGHGHACCARPAPPRSTCASPRRRTGGPASTGSTPRTGPSCSPPTCPSSEIGEYLDVDSPRLPRRSTHLVDGHRRPGRRVLRRLPDRQLPGAGAGRPSPAPARRSSGVPAGPRRDRRRRRPGPDRGPIRADARPTYAGAGVDIEAGERAVERIRPLVGLHPPARGARRHRRLRRAVRAGHRPATASRCWWPPPTAWAPRPLVARAARPVRHRRHRPGGHVRRRPGVPGRRAAVLPRLHLGRAAGPGPGRPSSWPGWPRAAARPAAPSSAARWPSTPASWRRRVRPGRLRRRASSSGTRLLGPAPGAGRATCSIGLPSPGSALQRLLPGPPGAARAGRPRPRRAGLAGCVRHPGRRAAAAVGHLHAGRAGRPSPRPTSTPWPTSPAAGSPATCPASCPTGLRAVLDREHVGGAAASSRRSSASGDVADEEMARVFNLGLGMVMVVAAGPGTIEARPGAPGRRRVEADAAVAGGSEAVSAGVELVGTDRSGPTSPGPRPA